ncbi:MULTISPECIES: PTS mannose/fructose/sorbose transporter subunit IIC [Lacticaseibacillus]|uniref:PTS mannose/fructose/sorbose transporter subunit IIC n=2 Tax=Lacticaseibacillus TaxID=2759736 RepID=A0ABW4CHL7_9LACO|nr:MULTISPECIES: PTS mannose/fructose/sorbose transporter subunit IIC [Lacticaseibacillus]
MSAITIILVLIVAFFAGMEGILDEFEFHQPIIACALIGLVTGHPVEGLLLGGQLQLIALGWMNVGAAVAPDAALASVAAAILVTMKGSDVDTAVALAMPLAVAGLVLTIFVRSITVGLAHGADNQAKKGSFRGVEAYHLTALMLQGLRIVIPAALVIAIPAETVQGVLNAIPEVIKFGLQAGGGMIVAVGYAMVINMMATPALWPWFFIGFAMSAVSEISLIGMGIIGVCLALVYLQLSPKFNGGGGNSGGNAGGAGGDPLDDILNDYE